MFALILTWPSMSLAEINRPTQTTRLGLYAVWFPTGITCADLLRGFGVKDWEEKNVSSWLATLRGWQLGRGQRRKSCLITVGIPRGMEGTAQHHWEYVALLLVKMIRERNNGWSLGRKYACKCKDNTKENLDRPADWFGESGSSRV